MKLLLYCTKNKPYLVKDGDRGYIVNWAWWLDEWKLNGKIVAECDFEVEEIKNNLTNNNSHLELSTDKLTEEKLFEKSCLNRYEMFNYLQNNFTKKGEPNGYAIHIKNLHIFDKSKELDDYTNHCGSLVWEGIKKAPQNMMRCYKGLDQDYILISIRPEWLCKILNGEKTIEVRKKVLKEML